MKDPFVDYYAVLELPVGASPERIRKQFRRRLLELHPDKAAEPRHPRLLEQLLRAFEVLGNKALRRKYDRHLETRQRVLESRRSRLPHVLDSERPADRARAVLYLLTQQRAKEAVARLDELEAPAIPFLATHLDTGEFIDAAFLIGEYFEGRGLLVPALEWYQEILSRERRRKRHRPCHGETLERAKRVLIHGLTTDADPRVALTYLRRAERLGLERGEEVELLKRRAQCYLELDMRHEAARNVRLARQLQPGCKGMRRLEKQLAEYLE